MAWVGHGPFPNILDELAVMVKHDHLSSEFCVEHIHVYNCYIIRDRIEVCTGRMWKWDIKTGPRNLDQEVTTPTQNFMDGRSAILINERSENIHE
jgi:hypothetical protein